MILLRRRDFGLLWIGQLVSQLGNQLNYVALAWLVLTTTGSTTLTGGVFLAQILPNALFGWWAGVVVDRFPRRVLMIAVDLLRGLLVLLIPLTGQTWIIFPVTFLVSSLSLMFYSAEKSLIPRLVEEDDLTEANAYAEMTAQAASLFGPVLAGLLVAWLTSPVHVLYIDAATFVVSALALAFMRARPEPGATSPLTPRQLLAEAREGLSYLLRSRFLRLVFLTAMAGNFLAMPFAVLFPVFSERALGAGPQGFGWLMGGVGAGMVLGSLAAAPLARRLRPATVIYAGMGLLGAAFALMSVAPNLPVSVLLAALAGFGVAPGNAVVITLVQRTTPPEMHGRVFSSLFATVGLAAPLGVTLASPLVGLVGPRAMLLGLGCATLGVAALGYGLLSREEVPGVRPEPGSP
ncbi:MFS transporter [bacterium CPR1]|nr:MFS transporter [bacterium CPR1]